MAHCASPSDHNWLYSGVGTSNGRVVNVYRCSKCGATKSG